MDVRKFTVGDRLRSIRATLVDPDGTAIVLTGMTVKFRMTHSVTEAVKVNDQDATLDDAANGQVSYAWAAADVDTAGVYWGQFIRVSGGQEEHHPLGKELKIIFEAEV